MYEGKGKSAKEEHSDEHIHDHEHDGHEHVHEHPVENQHEPNQTALEDHKEIPNQ